MGALWQRMHDADACVPAYSVRETVCFIKLNRTDCEITEIAAVVAAVQLYILQTSVVCPLAVRIRMNSILRNSSTIKHHE